MRSIIALLLFCHGVLTSQDYLSGIHCVWDDRFDEWEVVVIRNSEEKEIRISQIWPLRNNWEEWRIEGDEINGTIKTKWRGDISQWELRTDVDLVLISQLYRGDLNRWEVRDGTDRLTVSTRYFNNANDWHVPRLRDKWSMYTEYADDPRDWVIEDYLDETHSPAFKLAMTFIALWHSIPKS